MTDNLTEYYKSLNAINISDDDLDLPIFRFISFVDLNELLIDKKIALVKPKLWEDPYESYLTKIPVFYQNTIVNLSDLEEQVFAQCWTLLSESDALWRIYSHDKKGLRIKTTIRKLRDATYKMGQTYLGRVQYGTKAEFKKYFGSLNQGDTLLNSKSIIETLLWKRDAFEHEKEVRVVYMVDTNSIDIDKLSEDFPIIPNDFIEDILLDPRIDFRTEHIYRRAINTLGFIGSVEKSDLYYLEQVTMSLY